MTAISGRVSRFGAAVAIGALLALAGCGGSNVKSPAIVAAQESGQFGSTIESYKSGQFLVDGAVLSALDLGAHYAYLKEQNHLPKSVLLERSDDAKVTSRHLEYMTRLALDYGFAVYYEHKGDLVKLNAVEEKARPLEDTETKLKVPDPLQGKAASDGGLRTQNGDNGY